MTPPDSGHEAARLDALHRYHVLDTAPEGAFDDLARLAAMLCGAPVALISFVDADRQWFKSCIGLSASETPRSVAFCDATIRQTDLLIVTDASADPRFASNPFVVSTPHIRFYAGAPLITPDGFVLGTLCVVDYVPRQLTPEQEEALRTLGRHVMTELQLRKSLAETRRAEEAALAAQEERDARVQERTERLTQVNRALRRSQEEETAFLLRLEALQVVHNQLIRITDLDTFCQTVITLGRDRLGFDRLSLWLLADDPNFVTGTFGTDEKGVVRDERSARIPMEYTEAFMAMWSREKPYLLEHNHSVFDEKMNTVGQSDRAQAPLWDGRRILGYLSTDNLLSARSLTARDAEVLALYASTVGHLCSRILTEKRSEEELRYIMSGARCLLWHADIHTADKGELRWEMHVLDQEAAQGFLPVEMREGEAFETAWYRARLPEDRDRSDRFGYDRIRAGESYQQEYRCLGTDGRIRWIQEDVHIETVEADRRWRAVGVCTDMTDRKQMEQALRESQKMEGIGRLAGGIAHDFNNLLCVILGYAEMVEMELAEESSLRPSMQSIQKAATRAAKLTSQLLSFARKQINSVKVFRPNDLIVGMQGLLEPVVQEDAELIFRLSPGAGSVNADPRQIEQVIVNLVANAKDALSAAISPPPDSPGKVGAIIIETANRSLADHSLSEQSQVAPGEYVLIAISDTGMGMTAEVKAHLFEPFYTTKGLGRGTGLGLATVYGIVKQSGGYIFVYSEAGVGTTMKVYLPRVDAAPALEVDEAESAEPPLVEQGRETVLVVEDEPLVRNLMVTTLRAKGYQVLEAMHGDDGLHTATAYPGEIHLLITDVIMPGMRGRELADHLLPLRPGLKVLFVSGYTEDVTLLQGLLPEDTSFLQKPFTAREFMHLVRRALGTA